MSSERAKSFETFESLSQDIWKLVKAIDTLTPWDKMPVDDEDVTVIEGHLSDDVQNRTPELKKRYGTLNREIRVSIRGELGDQCCEWDSSAAISMILRDYAINTSQTFRDQRNLYAKQVTTPGYERYAEETFDEFETVFMQRRGVAMLREIKTIFQSRVADLYVASISSQS